MPSCATLAGSTTCITYVDFLVYDVLDKHRMFEPKCLDAFPNLKDFMGRFEVMPSCATLAGSTTCALEKISAYIKSSRFLTGPMYLKMALWGSK